MGDDENNPGGTDAEAATPNEPEAKAAPKEASLGDRKNAAKAFYRALYSGEDVVPEEFGIGTKTVEKQAATGPCPNCARLEAEAKESEKKATDNENYYKRIAADFENYRKRNDREREEAVGLGIQKAVESILPALDDLDRAKTSLATVTDPKAIIDSLNLVFARFSKCLEGLGVKSMDVLGEHFDPKFHEPVQEVKTTYFADGAVAQELRRGYLMRDRVIRPALVNVASNESGVITPMPATTEAAAPATAEKAAEPEVEAKVEPKTEANSETNSATQKSDESAVAADAQAKEKDTTAEPTGQTASGEASGIDEKNGEEPEATTAENEKAAADKAASKVRAANALERLRKPNPKATAELPAFRPEESERVTEPEKATETETRAPADKDLEVYEIPDIPDEEESTENASNKSD